MICPSSIPPQHILKGLYILLQRFLPIQLLAPLYIIAKKLKCSTCFLTDKWIVKLWYIYTKKLYSAVKNMKS